MKNLDWRLLLAVFLTVGCRVVTGLNMSKVVEEEDLDKELPGLRRVACSDPSDCDEIDGSYCDIDDGACLCKPDYPVTDTKNCYKEAKYDEFCFFDIQCQRKDKNSLCDHSINVCKCQDRFQPRSFSKGQFWCVEMSQSSLSLSNPASYIDPALFAILIGLALMFLVMCVVLRLFAKAQFRDNRSIFNTPNPRLMNVSLIDRGSRVRSFVHGVYGGATVSARKKSGNSDGDHHGRRKSNAQGSREDDVFIEVKEGDEDENPGK